MPTIAAQTGGTVDVAIATANAAPAAPAEIADAVAPVATKALAPPRLGKAAEGDGPRAADAVRARDVVSRAEATNREEASRIEGNNNPSSN